MSRPKSMNSTMVMESIIALAPGRGESEIGIALLEWNSCTLLQISDTCTFAKTLSTIMTHDPCFIIMPDTSQVTKLQLIIQESFGVELVFLPRKCFSDAAGLDFLKKYSSSETTVDTDQFYALAALAGLLSWAESHLDLRVSSLSFSTQNLQGILLLDLITTRNLEVIRGNKSDLCLIKVVDYTVTRMGKRLLRMSLCQPLFDQGLIENRLDAVEELNTFNSGIKTLLKKCPDLDMVLRGLNLISQKALVKHAEQSINHILQLKLILVILKDITSDLKKTTSSLLVTICDILNHEKLNDIVEIIDNVINEDVVYQKSSIGQRHQRCFAVKSGYNGLLDVARQTYKETTDDVYDLIKDYSEKHSLPIKSNFEVKMGFFMSIPEENIQGKNLPLEFINVVKKKKNIVFTTLKLVIP